MYRAQFYIIFCFLVHLPSTPPCELIMTEYSKHERDERNWFSPPFYSGPRGYKMCLCVVNEPRDAYELVSFNNALVCVYLMRGEYDDRLVWPFYGDVTIQLVNLIINKNHQESTIRFDGRSSIFDRRPLNTSCDRVTSGERAMIGCRKKVFSLQESKNIMYIKDDCVKFRVTRVILAS